MSRRRRRRRRAGVRTLSAWARVHRRVFVRTGPLAKRVRADRPQRPCMSCVRRGHVAQLLKQTKEFIFFLFEDLLVYAGTRAGRYRLKAKITIDHRFSVMEAETPLGLRVSATAQCRAPPPPQHVRRPHRYSARTSRWKSWHATRHPGTCGCGTSRAACSRRRCVSHGALQCAGRLIPCGALQIGKLRRMSTNVKTARPSASRDSLCKAAAVLTARATVPRSHGAAGREHQLLGVPRGRGGPGRPVCLPHQLQQLVRTAARNPVGRS